MNEFKNVRISDDYNHADVWVLNNDKNDKNDKNNEVINREYDNLKKRPEKFNNNFGYDNWKIQSKN
jgi:hypothetical protein